MTVSIKKLYLTSFGQFENTSIDLESGFNLIYGKNESGKSTITSFIEGILYGFDEGSRVRHFNKKQEIYRPINSYKYAGYAIFSKDGVDYRVSRNFDDGAYEIYDFSINEVMKVKESNLNYPGEFLLGLEYELYKNLITAFQRQETSENSRNKIRELLINKDDYNFSANDALNFLDNKLANIGTMRAYTKPYAKTINEIDELSKKILDLKSLRSSYYNDFKKLDKNRNNIEKKTRILKDLRKDRDAYRENIAYKNLEDEIKYQNELNYVNAELDKYKNYEFYDEVKEVDTNKTSHIGFYILICLILVFLGIYTKQYYLFTLAIILPLISILIDKNSNISSSDDTLNYKRDEDYLEYMRLSKEKEKIEEILRVLQNQDKTKSHENIMAIKDLDINETENKIRKLENELESLNKINIDLEKKLASAEEKLQKEVDLTDRLHKLETNLKDMEEEIEAINIAKSYISEIMEDASKNSNNFESEISQIINTISKGKYDKIFYDKEFNPQIIRDDGIKLDIDKLSTGFYDQLNFALKFSINEATLDNFLIFDDAFINYDLDRLRSALFYLLDESYNRQIIYFTCHKREEEILYSEAINYHRIYLEEL
ncbi:MAG: AAA family ATPase [Anaerococcus sp.]|uniref:ATP-binding protein n=1 Tax=Anaerococcus sp. TaxID=1872515 RepID=UPI0029039E3C|nr:AAA family ATPase [Anaerococcus sp.]MDU1864714.1 AAA family ATPase [Anaerococcus sp.]